MLSFEHMQRALMVLPMVAAVSLTSACGFRPLHQTPQQSAILQNQLASITIVKAKDRLHQQVRNHLLYLFGSANSAAPSRYKLEIKLTESEYDILVQRTSRTDRKVYHLKADFKLFDLANTQGKNKRPVYSGTDLVKRAYNRTASEFNNLRARKNASELTSRKIAENLHLRISAWLTRTQKN